MKPFKLTAGHTIKNGKGTGAFGVRESNGIQFDEAVEARALVNAIIGHQKRWYKLDTYTDKDDWSLSKVITDLIAWAKDETYLCGEIHFNAATSPLARGVEVYIPRNYKRLELKIAEDIAKTLSKILDSPLREGVLARKGIRGVKLDNEGHHSGLPILTRPHKGTNFLIEICFITNPIEVNKYRTKYYNIVKELSDLFGRYRKA